MAMEIIEKIIRDNEVTKQSLAPAADQFFAFLFPVDKAKLRHANLVITQTGFADSNSLILGHSTNGFIGTGFFGLGGGQIILGGSGTSEVEILRRRFEWRTFQELARCTYDPNISIQNGQIRLV